MNTGVAHKTLRNKIVSFFFGIGLVILPEKPVSNELAQFEQIQGETHVIQNRAAKTKQKKVEKAALDRLNQGIGSLPIMPLSGR